MMTQRTSHRLISQSCIALTTFAVFLFATGGARAATNTSELPIMMEVAQQYFGPGCEPIVEWVGHGQLNGPDAPGEHVAGRGKNCRIWLDEITFLEATWVDACETVVHEYGHAVLDLPHSHDPTSIMSEAKIREPFLPCIAADPVTERERWVAAIWDKIERLDDRAERLWSKAHKTRHRAQRRRLESKARKLEAQAKRLSDKTIIY